MDLKNKFAKSKFTLITVCVDQDDKYDLALKILKSKDAVLTNYWINDGINHEEKLAEEWKFLGFPAVYVFDQAGEMVMNNIDNLDLTVADIEKKVVQLLDTN